MSRFRDVSKFSISYIPPKNEITIGPAPPAYTQLLPCIKQHYGLPAAADGEIYEALSNTNDAAHMLFVSCPN